MKSIEDIQSAMIHDTRVSGDGQYIWIPVKGGGQVQVKFESEGLVIDVYDDTDQNVDTMCVFYHEMQELDEDFESEI